jgi:hypothetical protein
MIYDVVNRLENGQPAELAFTGKPCQHPSQEDMMYLYQLVTG